MTDARQRFHQITTTLTLLSAMQDIDAFGQELTQYKSTPKMPVLFIGHGNPMNAILDNSFSKTWKKLGAQLPEPKAILCVSAHWLTRGSFVTTNAQPKTIHDFGGFPDELFRQHYPAPGATDFANQTIHAIKEPQIHGTEEWGLDHGTWSVLKPMYPNANIPVYQLSLDFYKPLQYHFDLGKQLQFLRTKGVLIVASGNVVHNLQKIKWEGGDYDWAHCFDEFVKNKIDAHQFQELVDYQKLGSIASLAHPSNDHYLPLLYTLGLADKQDKHQYFNTQFDLGAVSMRSVIFSPDTYQL